MAQVAYKKRLLTVKDFLEMGRQGILRPDERVELIRGEIVVMAPQGPVHANCIRRLTMLFTRRIVEHGHDIAEVSVQLPMVTSEHDAPEPDVTLVRAGDYADRHPAGGDVLLAVEVSVTTLRYDRDVKVPLFAEAGIPEVWIVNFEENVLEVYRDLHEGRYRNRLSLSTGEEVSVVLLPELGSLKVEDLLG